MLQRPLAKLRWLKTRAAPLLHLAAFFSGGSALAARGQRALRIIMLHGVGDESYPLPVFRAQMRFLARCYRVVPLDRLVALATDPGARPTHQLALTFDDGLRNNLTLAYPVLRSLGLPATFYVCPGVIEEGGWIWTVEARVRLAWMETGARAELARHFGLETSEVEQVQHWMKTLPDGERRRVFAELVEATRAYRPTARDRADHDVMSWDELGQLDPAVVTVGSHTVSHPMLTRCSSVDQAREIAESQAWIERRLGRPVRHFCYPDAFHDESAVRLVAGRYDSAVTDVGLVKPGADPYRLPRIPVAVNLPYLAWRMHRPHA